MKKEYLWFIMGCLITAVFVLGSELNEFKSMAKIQDMNTQAYNHINTVTSETAADARATRAALPELYKENQAMRNQLEGLNAKFYSMQQSLEGRIAELNYKLDRLNQSGEATQDGPVYTTSYPIR